MPQSIQGWLLSEGFKIEGDHFVKGDVKIPFTEIIGHSLHSFQTKAFRQGWAQPPNKGLGKPLPFVV